MKIQLTVNGETLDICSVNIGKGREHDFSLFKKSNLRIHERIQIIADKGYQGLKQEHMNSLIPVKKTKYHNLNEVEQAYNHAISQDRIKIEHVNGYLKRFKILSSKFRNERSHMKKVVRLICGIYNFQHIR